MVAAALTLTLTLTLTRTRTRTLIITLTLTLTLTRWLLRGVGAARRSNSSALLRVLVSEGVWESCGLG